MKLKERFLFYCYHFESSLPKNCCNGTGSVLLFSLSGHDMLQRHSQPGSSGAKRKQQAFDYAVSAAGGPGRQLWEESGHITLFKLLRRVRVWESELSH